MAEEPEAKRVRLDPSERGSKEIAIDPQVAQHLMTPKNLKLLLEVCGTELNYNAHNGMADIFGSPEQVKACVKVLARIQSHCSWGANEDKVSRIIKPKKVEAVLVRLSPMGVLPSIQKRLNESTTQLTIGKEKTNDLVIPDPHVSRQHCLIEFDITKGAVYIIDMSTNGSFLNNNRLPTKMSGKVILSHADDLVIKDQEKDPAREFGWIVNIEEIAVKEEVVLKAPRRLLTDSDTFDLRQFPVESGSAPRASA